MPVTKAITEIGLRCANFRSVSHKKAWDPVLALPGPDDPAPEKETYMLYWALIFFVVAIVAGLFGFGGIAGTAASIAQILFFVFLVLLVVSLIAHVMKGRPPRF